MSKYLIAVDDGHGMETAGKRTAPLKSKLEFRGKTFKKGDIIHENDFNENLMELFIEGCKRHGIDTLQLAPGDSDVSLQNRVIKANKAGVDITVSFHANALSGSTWQSKAYGLVVIHSANCQSKTKELANNVYNYLSKEVDWYKDGGTKYGVRADKDVSGFSLYILSQTKSPAILVEYGFMDNWEDVKRMVTPEFQVSCVEATLKGVCKTLGVAYKPLEPKGDMKVRIISETLNIRAHSSIKYPKVGMVKKGEVFTIVDVENGWGKLKSGKGYICLSDKYVKIL